MRALVVLLAAVLLLAAAAQGQQYHPPDLEGRWEDAFCNLVVGSNNLFRKRIILYGEYDVDAGEGSWELTERFYDSDPTCDAGSLIYQTVTAGIYRETGQKAHLERFWITDYAIERRRMEVYTTEFGDYLSGVRQCNFASRWVPNVEQDITDVECPQLYLIPRSECPVRYDITRRTANGRLFVGKKWVGEPLEYQPGCAKQYRPREADDFYLLEVKTPDTPPTQADSVNEYNTPPRPSEDILVGSPHTTIPAVAPFSIENHLQTEELDTTAAASASSLSLLLLLSSLFLALLI